MCRDPCTLCPLTVSNVRVWNYEINYFRRTCLVLPSLFKKQWMLNSCVNGFCIDCGIVISNLTIHLKVSVFKNPPKPALVNFTVIAPEYPNMHSTTWFHIFNINDVLNISNSHKKTSRGLVTPFFDEPAQKIIQWYHKFPLTPTPDHKNAFLNWLSGLNVMILQLNKYHQLYTWLLFVTKDWRTG